MQVGKGECKGEKGKGKCDEQGKGQGKEHGHGHGHGHGQGQGKGQGKGHCSDEQAKEGKCKGKWACWERRQDVQPLDLLMWILLLNVKCV